MVKKSQCENSKIILKNYPQSAKGSEKNSISNMVERFVQSIGEINDSGAFDTSFEVKHLQSSPQRLRHRCVTELDRESLMQFVREFEAKQPNNNNNKNSSTKSTPKNSPYLCRKAKAIYQNTFIGNGTPKFRQPAKTAISSDYEDIELAPAATSMPAPSTDLPNNLQRLQPERSSYRSAVKMLQFFSAKKKSKPEKSCSGTKTNTNDLPAVVHSSVNSTRSNSPVIIRDCQPDADDNLELYPDDGISSASSNFTTQSSSSRNWSPDSSFELHAPLMPCFKVTPPQNAKCSNRNPAAEFARFLRGSFHAKRASVTKLRRSISDPDNLQNVDFCKPTQRAPAANCAKSAVIVKKEPTPQILADTTNFSRADFVRNRALPANASPFRRAWGQSSFRTPRTDKHAQATYHQQQKHLLKQSPLVRRAASMTASDNDVYIKSMDYIEELKQTRSQQQIATTTAATENACKKLNNAAPTTKIPLIKTIQSASEQKGVAAWGASFERMLEDPAGLHTFAEFLKKEFSAENIYFWTACERYRHIENVEERAKEAMAIFTKHLSDGSMEPVNVDSQARNLSEEKLRRAECDIFAPAQKQIFNLMKFDSYQRFIRSELYKSCLEAEKKQQPLPFSANGLDDLLKTHFHQDVSASSSKLKKSASNAEDRSRKSLLPWHRKTRSKSRDRIEVDLGKLKSSSKLPQLAGSSLRMLSTNQNSASDIHSSRSSLSSFDALPVVMNTLGASNGHAAETACSLCRVILSDGATTIVQTRAAETVGQLVERLLEKRGLTYQFYDVVVNGCTKSIDLQSPSQTIAGKEVLIEQRVAFKLDLPDPKVISVKSKPKKQLHEVIRPILHKYNYTMEAVQVVLRDTQEPLDLSLPVTVVDRQRLQIVLLPRQRLNAINYQNSEITSSKFVKPAVPKSVSFPTDLKQSAVPANTSQSTLDEITNKVFNELLQGKVEAHAAAEQQLTKTSDLCSLKSDDCASESSSLFDRMRRRDSNIPGLKSRHKKKSISSQHSEDHTNQSNNYTPTPTTTTTMPDVKKPIIAKLKAGVKLQVTERVAEKQDELLEGLKRAQLARLEDQRGTEINFELPEFLKNKENLSAAASKLRKVRANLSPVSKAFTVAATEATDPQMPQPAPRLSITNRTKAASVSPMKIDEDLPQATPPKTPDSQPQLETERHTSTEFNTTSSAKGPPPLPPKPKVLPIKPSNWGATATVPLPASPTSSTSKNPIELNRKSHLELTAARCAYLEEPSSSFV